MASKTSSQNSKVLKRQRVTAACQKCRHLKAKCDGVKPTCDRCTAYGYQCTWTSERRHKTNEQVIQTTTNTSLSALLDRSTLHTPTDLLYPLLQYLRPQLDEKDRQRLEEVCRTIDSIDRCDDETPPKQSPTTIARAQTYLGEASEGHFIRNINRDLGDSETDDVDPSSVDRSYAQDTSPLRSDHTSLLPPVSRSEGLRYMNIFTSTIGIAYPFIPLDQLDNAIRQWVDCPHTHNLSTNWQSLVLAIFAIGACYETLSSDELHLSSPHTNAKDRQFFQQSFNIAARYDHTRDIERAWARLAQCFYLLATTQIDRCWTNLGQVVRLAHSIGLHVESSTTSNDNDHNISREDRRTTWYCIYILDHLLSLQLGRPPAIYTPFFSVKPPSLVMALQDVNSPSINTNDASVRVQVSVRDYLLALIDLSNIIEEVMQTLYTPKHNSLADRSAIMTELDKRLLQWRSNLPRRLRFDLGHAFEGSSLHQRHRNFLAVKFYHLRSLIHRPSMSYLKRAATTSKTVVSVAALPVIAQQSITICIDSAQSTARLLYNIRNKEDVVHNFPWWQMISCLICASSILLVAIMDPELSTRTDTQAIKEDADICLEVFKALSVNSKAAEAALGLMNKLRATGSGVQSSGRLMPASDLRVSNESTQSAWQVEHPTVVAGANVLSLPAETNISENYSISPNIVSTQMDYNVFHDSTFMSMDNSMSDPLMWSTQFISDEFYPLADMTDFAGQ